MMKNVWRMKPGDIVELKDGGLILVWRPFATEDGFSGHPIGQNQFCDYVPEQVKRVFDGDTFKVAHFGTIVGEPGKDYGFVATLRPATPQSTEQIIDEKLAEVKKELLKELKD